MFTCHFFPYCIRSFFHQNTVPRRRPMSDSQLRITDAEPSALHCGCPTQATQTRGRSQPDYGGRSTQRDKLALSVILSLRLNFKKHKVFPRLWQDTTWWMVRRAHGPRQWHAKRRMHACMHACSPNGKSGAVQPAYPVRSGFEPLLPSVPSQNQLDGAVCKGQRGALRTTGSMS